MPEPKPPVLVISLPFPPSVNRLWRAGKGKVYRSDEYKAWIAEAAWSARAQAGTRKIKGQYKLSLSFTRPDARGRDLGNLEKAVSDCLQYAGVVANDKDCVELAMRWVPDGPPCLVEIEEINGESPTG